jgi:hypothetical protein
MWEIYDELIATVLPDLRVRECLIGLHWTLIRSRAIGKALTPSGPKQYGKQGSRRTHRGSKIGFLISQV